MSHHHHHPGFRRKKEDGYYLNRRPGTSSSHKRRIVRRNIHPSNWRHSDFEVLETLGTGTFGVVKLCRLKSDQVSSSSSTGPNMHVSGTTRKEKNEKYFAMKILQKSNVIRLKQVDHVISEKNLLSQLNHPFIVGIHKSYQDEYTLYMILEFVVGGELFSHLRKVGKFPNDVAKFYAAEICLALDYLHSKNIVYRDLKPENVLLSDGGHIKITDFGFAKKVVDKTWTLCGTPEYLAPEIIQSKGHGKAVDWWALGILIYEMLVGYPPFFDDSAFKIYEKIVSGKIEFPRFMDSAAKDLIRRLLVTDYTKRLGSLKNGAMDIKNHKWFRGVNWEAVYQKKIIAPIPVTICHPGDSRYYENYPEESKMDKTKLSSEIQKLFNDFEWLE